MTLFRFRNNPPTIADILRGCEAGRMQSVGLMQVIPLLSELEETRIDPPVEAVVSTSNYGTLVFHNPTGRLVLVPCHAAYVTELKAQDHALPEAAFVRARERRKYGRAMCVQQSQGGLIREDGHRYAILPLSLRRPALAKRKERDYSRLWGDIGDFNRGAGVAAGGNLVAFLKHFRRELDTFVAEFECLDRQVGAIVLVAGEVVGVERAPSRAYWRAVWEPLVRTCYGAFAVSVARECGEDGAAPATRVPLDGAGVTDLDGVAAALEKARADEERVARATVRSLLDQPFAVDRSDKQDDFVLETVRNAQLAGQVVRDDGRVVYASLVVNENWQRTHDWRAAPAFDL